MNATTVKTRLARIIDKNAVTAILPDGTSVDATRCTLHQSRTQLPGGYGKAYRGSVLIAYPTTLPTERAIMRVSGTWYRILGTEPDSLSSSLRIDLGEAKSEQ